MNILFFLKPKSEVAYVHDYGTLRQVLETMEYHKYASIPMLNKSANMSEQLRKEIFFGESKDIRI